MTDWCTIDDKCSAECDCTSDCTDTTVHCRSRSDGCRATVACSTGVGWDPRSKDTNVAIPRASSGSGSCCAARSNGWAVNCGWRSDDGNTAVLCGPRSDVCCAMAACSTGVDSDSRSKDTNVAIPRASSGSGSCCAAELHGLAWVGIGGSSSTCKLRDGGIDGHTDR